MSSNRQQQKQTACWRCWNRAYQKQRLESSELTLRKKRISNIGKQARRVFLKRYLLCNLVSRPVWSNHELTQHRTLAHAKSRVPTEEVGGDSQSVVSKDYSNN